MKDTIYRRRSCRSYRAEMLPQEELCKIEAFSKTLVPLDNGIKTAMQIVPGDAVRFYFPWKSPQLMAFLVKTSRAIWKMPVLCCNRWIFGFKAGDWVSAGWVLAS